MRGAAVTQKALDEKYRLAVWRHAVLVHAIDMLVDETSEAEHYLAHHAFVSAALEWWWLVLNKPGPLTFARMLAREVDEEDGVVEALTVLLFG